MRLFASADKMTVLISSTNCHSLVASLSFEFKNLLKAFKFWFSASLLAWLTHQFNQVVCVAIIIYSFTINSLIQMRGCIAQSVANQKARLEILESTLQFDCRDALLNPLQIEKQGWNETSQFSFAPLQSFKIASAFF
jgi:hypothetical protein